MVLVKVLEEQLKGKGYGMEVCGGVVHFIQGLFQTVAENTGMDAPRKEAVARLFFGRAMCRLIYRTREAPHNLQVTYQLQGETDVPEFDGYEVPQSGPWKEESAEEREARWSQSAT